MATQEDLKTAIASIIDAHWSEIVAEIEASPKKSNQLMVNANIKKNTDNTLTFGLQVSFKKQTVVSQTTTITA
jgi:hypothetical protein